MIWLYETGPVDIWTGWTFIEDYVGNLGRDDVDGRRHLFDFMFRALELARGNSSWEGDIRGREMYVSGLPPDNGDCACHLVIGWKQDNNGTTFIASEAEIPYLREALCKQQPEPWLRGRKVLA